MVLPNCRGEPGTGDWLFVPHGAEFLVRLQLALVAGVELASPSHCTRCTVHTVHTFPDGQRTLPCATSVTGCRLPLPGVSLKKRVDCASMRLNRGARVPMPSPCSTCRGKGVGEGEEMIFSIWVGTLAGGVPKKAVWGNM